MLETHNQILEYSPGKEEVVGSGPLPRWARGVQNRIQRSQRSNLGTERRAEPGRALRGEASDSGFTGLSPREGHSGDAGMDARC